MAGTKPSNAPAGKVWIKSILASLTWLLIFLTNEPGHLVREWRTDFYAQPGAKAMMQLDASVWGFGGVLLIDNVIVSWFSSPVSSADEQIHGLKRGDEKGQQVWEALCLLMALRLWTKFWTDKKLNITLKSDNMAALILVARMKSNASPLIAKEVAYAMSRAAFQPRLIVHVPGVMNFIADTLSRLSSHNN